MAKQRQRINYKKGIEGGINLLNPTYLRKMNTVRQAIHMCFYICMYIYIYVYVH